MGKGGILLRSVPKDIKDWLLDRQTELRKKKGTMVSLETVIYSIIRENKRSEVGNEPTD